MMIIYRTKVRYKVLDMEKEKCPYCGYEWVKRVDKVKQCPKCKRYL